MSVMSQKNKSRKEEIIFSLPAFYFISKIVRSMLSTFLAIQGALWHFTMYVLARMLSVTNKHTNIYVK